MSIAKTWRGDKRIDTLRMINRISMMLYTEKNCCACACLICYGWCEESRFLCSLAWKIWEGEGVGGGVQPITLTGLRLQEIRINGVLHSTDFTTMEACEGTVPLT